MTAVSTAAVQQVVTFVDVLKKKNSGWFVAVSSAFFFLAARWDFH